MKSRVRKHCFSITQTDRKAPSHANKTFPAGPYCFMLGVGVKCKNSECDFGGKRSHVPKADSGSFYQVTQFKWRPSLDVEIRIVYIIMTSQLLVLQVKLDAKHSLALLNSKQTRPDSGNIRDFCAPELFSLMGERRLRPCQRASANSTYRRRFSIAALLERR